MKKILLALLLCPAFMHAQVITTIAGTGTAGNSGDGGPATAAELNGPSQMAIDAAGNLYMADVYAFCVRKITPSGTISTYAGNGTSGFSGDGGPATAAQLATVQSIALDAAGNLYISDYSNLRVRKVSPAGIITTFAGNGTSGSTGDEGPATAASFFSVNAVAVDGSGNVYVSDPLAHKVRRVDASGTIHAFAGNGTSGITGDGGPATAASLTFPSGMAADGTGNVYISDLTGRTIRKVDATGKISRVAGTGLTGYSGNGGLATAARLDGPQFPFLDNYGYLYFPDCNNDVIRAVHLATGLIDVVAGTGTPGFAGDGGSPLACKLHNPSHFLRDGTSNAYITDNDNHRVRKITGFTISLATQHLDNISGPSLYPSPASTTVQIKCAMKTGNISILNSVGKTVYTGSYNEKEATIDVSALSAGMYFLLLNTGETLKFTKQ